MWILMIWLDINLHQMVENEIHNYKRNGWNRKLIKVVWDLHSLNRDCTVMDGMCILRERLKYETHISKRCFKYESPRQG